MKKLFVSLVAAMFTLFATAADDSALARITLTGTTSGGSCQLILIENPDYSAAYDNGFDAPCNINLAEALPKTLYMYSYIGADTYSTIATNNLDGLEFGFISNLLDDEYTMTFEVFTLAPGRTLTVYDESDPTKSRVIDPLNSYTFTAASGHHEYMRFLINQVPAPVYAATVTTNEDGWASFAFNADLAPVEAPVIYKGALDMTNPDAPVLNLSAVADIPAGEGVFIHGTANTEYHFNTTTATADMTGNDIEACVDATPVSAFAGDAIYTLRYANGATALYQYVGLDDIPAHKAVLPIATGGAPAPARIALRFAGEQGIDNVEAAVQAEKFVENGQIFIRRGNEVFNLQGQIVK